MMAVFDNYLVRVKEHLKILLSKEGFESTSYSGWILLLKGDL